MKKTTIACFCLTLAVVSPGKAQEKITDLVVDPNVVQLQGPQASYLLLVHGKSSASPDGVVDLGRVAQFRSEKPSIAAVSPKGLVRGIKDGVTEIHVAAGGKSAKIKVEVSGSQDVRPYHFERDVMPILSRFGCNSAGCHGNANGQNGFKLSVFGFDPPADHTALTKESRGRRVLHAAPEHSLLLAKASGQMAHGGGLRIPAESVEYDLLRRWIAAGTPLGDANVAQAVSVRVEPRQRVMRMLDQQQLRVVARFSDGRETDVTAYSRFQVNQETLAGVSADGLVTAGQIPGQAAIMASYMNCVDTFRVVVPRPGAMVAFAFPENNFVDGLVVRNLKKLNVAPSELSSDAEFLRRVYIDVIGTLPTPAEARRFLADKRTDKRGRVVDELLDRPEFADYWALKWADLLRVDRQVLGHKRAYTYFRWIRESLAHNKPFDQFARELLTAEGPLEEMGPANFYKVVTKPGETASTLSQVLLGVRIACAECHHHPYDRWSQTDYFGMQAFFAPLTLAKTGNGESILAKGDPVTKHPRTGELVEPHALGAASRSGVRPSSAADPRSLANSATYNDRRLVLAQWLTSPENPWFAKNLANRVWAHLLGRGLIDPIDDVRDTNPPSNPELLDALARHVIASKFDLKQLIRTIAKSRTYQLSSRPNPTNEKDTSNFSRALFRRIDAEVLLDMVSQTTGVAEKFGGNPPGTRAIQLWDSKVTHYFLKLYGRPQRLTACECERNVEPSVAQVLHLLNSPEIHAKMSHERGNVAKWIRDRKSDAELIDEMYLTYYSRLPDDMERRTGLAYLQRSGEQRRQAAEDLAWTLMNTLEFVFNH